MSIEISLWPRSCQQGCIEQVQAKCFSPARESKCLCHSISGIRDSAAFINVLEAPCLNLKILINQICFESSLVYSSWTSNARCCALSAPFQGPLPNPAASTYHVIAVYPTWFSYWSCFPHVISDSSFACSSPSTCLLKSPVSKRSLVPGAASSTSCSSMPKPGPYHSSTRNSGCFRLPQQAFNLLLQLSMVSSTIYLDKFDVRQLCRLASGHSSFCFHLWVILNMYLSLG